ncbi:MAG: hypothetical protein H6730_29480 [Deltaproteobacteria bacterium]|nr:hypothetical protein [Deltaproteobacteria bacterium]
MRSLRRLAAALLVLSSCQDGGEPLSTLVIPGPDVPRESPGVDPNPAPSPPVIGVVTSGQADLHVWPAGDMTSASLAPPDLDAFGLQAALSIQLVRWESGEPLFYEVADEANAVLVRRDEAGTLHRLRTRSVTSPTRTLAANGRWEVWWDGGLMVQSTAMGAEPRRYPVPDALNAPREVFAWGDDLIGAAVPASDGWHVWRIAEDVAPTDLGAVVSFEGEVRAADGVCTVWYPGGAGRVAFDGSVSRVSIPEGRATYLFFGSKALVMSNTEHRWVDFVRNTSRTLAARLSADTVLAYRRAARYEVLNYPNGSLGVLDMETGATQEVRAAAGLSWPKVTSDGRRLVGLDTGAQEVRVVDVATGATLTRWPASGRTPWSLLTDRFLLLLAVDGVTARLDLETGRVALQDGDVAGVWGGLALLVQTWPTETWTMGFGRSTRRLFTDTRRWATLPDVVRSSPPRLLFGGDGEVLVDPEDGSRWEGRAGLFVSGARAWVCPGSQGDVVGFLDLTASAGLVRTAPAAGTSGCRAWPARSSVAFQRGDALEEATVEGSAVAFRALGDYQLLETWDGQSDLWARQGAAVFRFGQDGQPSLRWRLPEGFGRVVVRAAAHRALIYAEYDDAQRVFSVALSGAVDGFELSAAGTAALPGVDGLLERLVLDAQGRVLVAREGRILAYGASEEPEVILDLPGDTVRDLVGMGGRWIAYVSGPQGAHLWWSGAEGPRSVRLSTVAMPGFIRWKDEALVLVRAAAAEYAFDPIQERVHRLPRGGLGEGGDWQVLDAGRLVGTRPGWAGVWVWNTANDAMTPMLQRGLQWISPVIVLEAPGAAAQTLPGGWSADPPR